MLALLDGQPEVLAYRHPPLQYRLATLGLRGWIAAFSGGRSVDRQWGALLALRGVSALAGTLEILALYALARSFVGRAAALVTCLLLAVMPLAVVSDKYGVPDALLSLFVVAGLVAALRVHASGSRGAYLGAGLAIGLGSAAKYNALALLLPLATAHALYLRSPAGAGRRWWAGCGWAALGLAGGLLVGFPADPALWQRAARGFGAEGEHAFVRGHLGIAISGPEHFYVFHVVHSLAPAAGVPLLLLMLGGVALLALRGGTRASVLLAFVIPYDLVMEQAFKIPPSPERYVLPLLGPLLVAAAVAAEALARRLEGPRAPEATAALLLLVGVVPAVRTARVLRDMAPDTRETMGAWMAGGLPPGARVVTELRKSAYYPPLDRFTAVSFDGSIATGAAQIPCTGYVLASSFMYDRYRDDPGDVPFMTRYYERVFAEGRLLHEVTAPSGPYLFQNPVLRLYAVDCPSLEAP